MSTSLLYHAFGIRGYRYVKTKYVGGEIIFTIEQPLESCRCSAESVHQSHKALVDGASRDPLGYRRRAAKRRRAASSCLRSALSRRSSTRYWRTASG